MGTKNFIANFSLPNGQDLKDGERIWKNTKTKELSINGGKEYLYTNNYSKEKVIIYFSKIGKGDTDDDIFMASQLWVGESHPTAHWSVCTFPSDQILLSLIG